MALCLPRQESCSILSSHSCSLLHCQNACLRGCSSDASCHLSLGKERKMSRLLCAPLLLISSNTTAFIPKRSTFHSSSCPVRRSVPPVSKPTDPSSSPWVCSFLLRCFLHHWQFRVGPLLLTALEEYCWGGRSCPEFSLMSTDNCL